MKKKLLTILVIGGLVVGLTGCGNNKDNVNQNANGENVDAKEEVKSIRDNSIYFVSIDGTKFKAGDKISDVSKVNLKQKDKDLEEKIPKNRYLLSKAVVNSDNKEICKFVPLNSTESTITVKDAVIGGFEVGSYTMDKVSEETLALNIEVVGGIKLGSSYEDIVKVLGEEDYKSEHEATNLLPAYTTYKYSMGYKGYEFIIDDSGKVSQIKWNNYDYDE